MNAIEKLKALESAATPGLWQQTTSGDAHWLREVRDSGNRGLAWCGHSHLASAHGDARFITIFRNLAPRFIALWEAADATCKMLVPCRKTEPGVYYHGPCEICDLREALDALEAAAEGEIP